MRCLPLWRGDVCLNMNLFESGVGRKLIMAVSGLALIGFVLVHLVGNFSLFSGADGINAYASALHRLYPVVWAVRLGVGLLFSLHVFYGIQLTLENRAAKPQAYAVRKSRASTFAGETMIWTGLLIAAFLFCHLLQFVVQVIHPEFAASRHLDAVGRPDVFMMVALNFKSYLVSGGYVFALAALGLHLSHSLQSSLQTLGLPGEKSLPVIERIGRLAAIFIFLGFSSFPLFVLLCFLK